ncbi:MAG: hypothetical protein QOF73_5539, partial [Thermomicrobiales bacterium]|nr:hypothetical protein [Thermomicrobiales bacterium]
EATTHRRIRFLCGSQLTSFTEASWSIADPETVSRGSPESEKCGVGSASADGIRACGPTRRASDEASVVGRRSSVAGDDAVPRGSSGGRAATGPVWSSFSCAEGLRRWGRTERSGWWWSVTNRGSVGAAQARTAYRVCRLRRIIELMILFVNTRVGSLLASFPHDDWRCAWASQRSRRTSCGLGGGGVSRASSSVVLYAATRRACEWP